MRDVSKRQADAMELPPDAMRAAQAVFDEWWDRYEDVIYENGSRGNAQALFAALWESWKKRV